ncbi:hypothetical protein [Nannocystis radixulma]|uniref:Lipoprotein n=1 Tax=Nannocystis radixulma TaxID=2995305 RepID=A0ABT5BCX3_9BACT|nr:hypothetical protein [Nannocystis radixulma]MDC0671568.1 hypothetical protein [Nannocystis radixulma]
MTRGRTIHGSFALGAALVAGGCFHDEPPQLGCAAMSVCSTTSTSTSAMEGETTSTSSSTTGSPLPEPRTFRIDSLRLVDPHLFSDICFDVTGLVNMVGLAQQLDDGELNLILHFEDFDPDDLAAVLGEAMSCDLTAQTCVQDEGVNLQLPVERVTEAPCLELDPAVLAEDAVKALYSPEPTCFRTGAAELALPLGAATAPINLLHTQVTFNFDDIDDPQAIQRGVISGFLTRASAESADVEVSGSTYNLWTLVHATDECVMQHPKLLPSVDEFAGPNGPVEGVWLAFNATASRIALVPP